MPDFDADLSTEIHRVLADFLRHSGDSIRHVEPTFGPAVDALSDFVLGGGKRLRPTFAWWAWRGAGGDPRSPEAESVLRAVSSLELIQACALIHDDVIDSSDSRRGAPTVHVAFAARHRRGHWLGSPESFGRAAAVLIGDLALAWAEDMFAQSGVDPAVLAAGRPAWQAMRTEVLAGQYLDVHTQATGDSSMEAALRVDRLKTAAYTVQRPVHLGAALAGASPELIELLLEFGRDLGVAFQLRDDLLGVFGDPSVTGKPAGDDLREGKRTLLLALGLSYAEQQGKDGQRKVIADAVGDPRLTDDDVAEVREALVEVGAVAEVEQRITAMTGNALDCLHRAALAEPAGHHLAQLADKATRRVY